MGRRRILLVCGQSLLGESLTNLLASMEDVEVLGTWDPGPLTVTQIADLAPDLVIVTEEGAEMEGKGSLTGAILDRHPGLPVIRVGLSEKLMRVHTSRSLPARTADLIELIRQLPLPGGSDRPSGGGHGPKEGRSSR